MKGKLKIITIIGFILIILNTTFYNGILPFIKKSIGSHNGEEEYLIILTGLIAFIFLIKGGIGLYNKNNSILNFSLTGIGLNLLLWFYIFSNIDCINCSLA